MKVLSLLATVFLLMTSNVLAQDNCNVSERDNDGYNHCELGTLNFNEAIKVTQEKPYCDVFKEQDSKYYWVLCKSNEYITNGRKTYKRIL